MTRGLYLVRRPRLLPAAHPHTHRRALCSALWTGLRSLGSGADVLMIFATSVIIWLLETVKYWFVMHAFHFQVGFIVLMLMNGMVNLATTLPSAPGYIGTFDTPGIETLAAFGVERNLAASYTFTLHAALWLPVTARRRLLSSGANNCVGTTLARHASRLRRLSAQPAIEGRAESSWHARRSSSMKNIAVAGDRLCRSDHRHLLCRPGQQGHLHRHQRREDRHAPQRQGADLRAGPGRDDQAQCHAPAVLHFTTAYADALADAEFVFICVGTPSGVDGEADLRYVRMAAESIARTMTHPLIIVNKSTVPVGTGDWVADIVTRSQPKPIDFAVVSCPEFLREGSALSDFMNPDRVVLGARTRMPPRRSPSLHLPLRTRIVITDLRTAEMIKYATNAFLATKISFINEIATICEKLGADVQEVAAGMGYDKRIGPHFLDAGLGYGGSCFPKDVKALEHMALVHGSHPALLRAVMEINRDARRWAVFTLRELLGGQLNREQIGLLGLAFKPNTDDIREVARA